MANYYASARSNYFKVKNQDAFVQWVDSLSDCEAWTEGDRVGFCSTGGNCAGWPSMRLNAATDEYEALDILQELSQHLAVGEVAVLMESGAEKLRYITGIANAVNHKGEVVHVSIDEIYQRAFEQFGVMPTHAQY